MLNTHRSLKAAAIAGLLLLVVSACSESGLTAVEAEAPLAGPTWTLTGFEAADGTISGPGSETIRVTFKPEGQVGGQSRTNEFDGTYRAVANRNLTVETLETTLAGLPEGSRYMEFYSALRAATTYAVQQQTLRIAYGPDGAALRFAQTAPENE